MGYPQGPPGQGQPPQQGGYYPQQPQQPQQQQGYYQQQPQQQPPQGGYGGYAPFQGQQGQPQGMTEAGYNWGELYGMADHSIRLLDKGQYDAIVESSSWDRTKDGTKGAWTIVFRTTTGMYPDTKLTMTLAVSKTKKDGSTNDQGMGIMFRHLAAMGIPVPPAQPFWTMGMAEPQVAQAMVGRPVLLSVIQDEYDGITRNKVRDIMPPRPGAPTARVQAQQPQQAPQPFNQPQQGQMQPPPQQQWNPQQGYMGQPPPQPGMAPQPYQQPQGQPQGYQQPQQGPPPGYQAPQYQAPQYQPPPQQQQGPPAGWQPDPNQPPYGQPAAPGQGGMGQFTQQGQAFQPGTNPAQTQQAAQAMNQPPFGPNGMPGQPPYQQQGQPPQQGQPGQEGPPPMPPGMQ